MTTTTTSTTRTPVNLEGFRWYPYALDDDDDEEGKMEMWKDLGGVRCYGVVASRFAQIARRDLKVQVEARLKQGVGRREHLFTLHFPHWA
jgi:hypothetical protein